MSGKKYTFLLVGKTGVGKSALGNNILSNDAFESYDSFSSVTTDISVEKTNRSGFDITVIDTPGFMDTRVDEHEARLKACNDMRDSMSLCPTDGLLAVIFVIKYGERYSIENMTTLYILEHIFGKENLWKSCVIAMTDGENYDLNYRNTKSFKEYVIQQEGNLGKLFKESNNKVALFHNLTKDSVTKQNDFEMLMTFVNELNQGYTLSKFKSAKKEKNRLELESQLPQLKMEFEEAIVKLTHDINFTELSVNSLADVEELERTLNIHLTRADETDTPDKIYYKQGEIPFLQDIRDSLGKLYKIFIQKKTKIQQMKLSKEIVSQIEKITCEMTARGHKSDGFYMNFKSSKEQLAEISIALSKLGLSKDLTEHIELKLKEAELVLENLKIKSEQEKESQYKLQMNEIEQSLNEIKISDLNLPQTVFQLNSDLNKLKIGIQEAHTLVSPFFIQNIMANIGNIEKNIRNKLNSYEQYSKKEEIENEIFAISQTIKNTSQNADTIYYIIKVIEESLKNIRLKIITTHLSKNLIDDLALSIEKTEEKLAILKKQVQNKKENELNFKIKSIMRRLENVCSFDESSSTTLKEIQEEANTLQLTLKSDALNVGHTFLEVSNNSMTQIQSEIKTKEEEIIHSLKIRSFYKRINDIEKKMELTSLQDENILTILFDFGKTIETMHADVVKAGFKVNFSSSLLITIKTTKKKLKRMQKSARALTEAKINKQIDNIEGIINGLNYKSKKFHDTLSEIKPMILSVKVTFDQNKLFLDDISIISITFLLMLLNKKFKTKETFEVCREKKKLEKSLSDMKWKILETDVKGRNSYMIMCNFQSDLNNISKAVGNVQEAEDLTKLIIEIEKLLEDQKSYIMQLQKLDKK